MIPFALLLLIGAGPQASRVPGSSVSLEPPPGFTASSRFAGFERADLQASIMVTEIPGPFASVTGGMNAAGLATRGMTLIASGRTQVDGKQALLLYVSQSAGGIEYVKWMLSAGDAKGTVMIVATFPKSAEAELGGALRASVLSARWTAAAAPDPFEGLPFRVAATASLKIAGRMNNLLLMTESGSMQPRGPGSAVFMIGSSVAPVQITDLAGFAEARARQTKQLRNLQISRHGSVTVAGSVAHELIAQGTDQASGRAVALYQVLLPEDGGYVLMQGLVATSRAAAMIPEFRTAAQSYQRVSR